jgi:serine kinase of HPr protein (carbohydrate metabolism regulator)
MMKMKVSDIVKKLGLKVHSGGMGLDREIKGGYVSDLLSDVMGNADAGMVWITLQTHKNVMAIASLKDLAAIILVKGLIPDADMAAQSETENIPVLGTGEQSFEIGGRLYDLIKDSAIKEIPLTGS